MYKRGSNDDQMHLCCWPFWWPRGCPWWAIQMALPNAACPGLPGKPMDATIGQLLTPYCPSGCQGNSKQNNDIKNGPLLLAISMAAVVHRYNIVRIAQLSWSRALVEATGCHHRASIAANRCIWSCICQFFWVFSLSICEKRSQVNAKDPVFNRGVAYQTNEKGLIKVSVWFVEGARLVEWHMD